MFKKYIRSITLLLFFLLLMPSHMVSAEIYPDKYQVPKDTLQLIVVKYKGSSKGTLTLYERSRVPLNQLEIGKLPTAGDGAAVDNTPGELEPPTFTKWKKVFSTNAYLGKKGIGKAKEGDGKTPTGLYGIGKAFGILSNPGTKLSYTKVNRYHYWCSDSGSSYYNKLIRTDKVKHKCKGEHLIQYKGSYDYSLFIKYNSKGVKGKGSAIFLHCSKGRATAGCVAIPKTYMKKLLKALDPKMKPMILIYK